MRAIINTLCYNSKINRPFRKLVQNLQKSLGPHIAFTLYGGHAADLAKESSAHDVLIVAGGDGTIFEVVNNIDLSFQTLAILPIGTGNNLAKDLGIRKTGNIFNTIDRRNVTEIDLISCKFRANGSYHQRFVVSTSGLGFVSSVADLCNRYLKITGPLCYPISSCCNVLQKKMSAEIQLEEDPPQETEFTNFIINNTKHAGNVCVFPDSDLRDSHFNFLLVRANALTQQLWNIGVVTKTYFYYPGVRNCKRLRITLRKPSALMMDGELVDSVEEVEYSVASEKLRLFV